ncbi:MAG: thiamine pyrophosphate-binding protein [Haloplanus sp.]
MRVNEAVVDRLVAAGVETVFGIPGKQTLPLNETIDARADVRFVVSRHETAVSHAAWGYAETSGRMAATCVVPGPGDMNAMNGLKNALNDCTPLLHLSVETDPHLRGGDAIHETPPDTYDGVVKANRTAETPASVVPTIDRAIETARTPPTGPVRVGIPKSFLGAEATVTGTETTGERRRAAPVEALDVAADRLAGADRPVVVAGGGVRTADASDALLSVATRLGAPVVTTYKGKGVVPEDHPLSAGVLCGGASADLRALLADADAALAVGTDLDAVATGGFEASLPDALVHVTLHPDDLDVGYDPAVGLVCDARVACAHLDDALADRGVEENGDGRARAVREADAARLDPLCERTDPLTSVAALAAVRDALPRDAVVSADAGGFRIWSLVSFPAYGPRSYVTTGSWATMGTGLPAAMGAALANPDRPAVALTGDGGLLMCVHELHTAASEGIPVTVVVFSNADYGIISEEAERRFDYDRTAFGWAASPLDLVTVAEGMGVPADRAETPEAVRSAVEDSLDAPGPRLVEVPVDPTEPQASEWMRAER